MNDFNRGALQIPCLRLDYGFGEQWASVELGDGTGYVRLADYEKLASENAKLRNMADKYVRQSYALACEKGNPITMDIIAEDARELGIEVD